MCTVTSRDGTEIAYETRGSGPAVVLVDGALCYRAFGPMTHLAELLAPHFTVFTYDRRGRGGSDDSKPYAVGREVEDIQALIQQIGAGVFVYGISSGACLALEAAIRLGNKVKKLALYEPPYTSDKEVLREWRGYRQQLEEYLTAGRRGDAVEIYMQAVGTPAEQVAAMRQASTWPLLERVAPTLAYDIALIGANRTPPLKRAAGVKVPTLILDGGANWVSMPFMHATATSLAKVIPHAQHRTLEGQTHDADPEVLAPVLIEFFAKVHSFQRGRRRVARSLR